MAAKLPFRTEVQKKDTGNKPVLSIVGNIDIDQTTKSHNQMKLQRQFLSMAGLSPGLLATLFGFHMSVAIGSTPAPMG
ncbi:MAG: hypothetical protein CMM01_12060 [Rhodopirellula sp.]|nr:hypothetical protein [Rhodopirellula sp.]